MSTNIKRNELKLREKQKLINDHKSGVYTQRQLSAKYKVSLGSVSNMLKNSDKYLSIDGKDLDYKRIRKNENLNEIVYQFIESSIASNKPITGPIVRKFAKEIAMNMCLNDFKASNGWLNKLLKRRSISLSRQSSGVPEPETIDCHKSLNEILDDFKPEDIFSFDETALLFKIMPKRFYSTKKGKDFCAKLTKQRVTIGLCCSMTGEKLKPIVIGSTLKPKPFEAIDYNIDSIGVQYFANPNTFMTRHVFNKWLQTIDRHFGKNDRKILLIINRESPHLNVLSLKNIAIKYIAVNTPKLHPLNQGIIGSFKTNYKTYFMKYLSAIIRDNVITDKNLINLNELKVKYILNEISLKDAINWIVNSWNDISPQVITHCFSIYCLNDKNVDEFEVKYDLTELRDNMSFIQHSIDERLMNSNHFLQLEDNIKCCSTDWRQDLIYESLECRPTDLDRDVIDISQEQTSSPKEVMNVNEALDRINSLEDFVMRQIPQMFLQFSQLKNSLISLKVRKQTSVQTSIKDYFE